MTKGGMVSAGLVLLGLVASGCGATSTGADPEPESPVASGAEEAEAPVRLLDDEEAARTQAQAMQTHVQARELQTRCENEGDEEACARAEDLFRVAADTWRALVEGRPDDEGIVDWSFMWSQALLHSGRYADAADAAARYVDSGADQWRAPAVRILVNASETAIAQDVLPVREEPPEPRGDPPSVRPVEMPEHVQRLYDARVTYAEVLGDREEEQETLRRHALENAKLLHAYGDWERARAALREVFVSGCNGEQAWEGAAEAWRHMREIAVALGRWDAVRELGEEVESLDCTFGEQARPACQGESDHPRCLARADAVTWRLQGGMRFVQRAERSQGEERRRWARRAAEAFLAALEVEGELDARGRVTALVEAGNAFRRAGDQESAAEVDRRIVADVDPEAVGEQDRAFARVTVASALFRQLEAAIRADDDAQVVELSRRLLADDLDMPELADERSRARTVLADALTELGRHGDAAEVYRAIAETEEDPARRRHAALDAALAEASSAGCRRARRSLEEFVEAHRGSDGSREAVLRALWRLAECERAGSRAHLEALEAVVEAGAAERGPISTDTREHLGEATFRLVDGGYEAATRLRVRVPRGDNVEDTVAALREQLAEPSAQVRELVQGYARVEEVGDPRWSTAARYRSGQALEALAAAVLEADWEIPADLASQRRELTTNAFNQLRGIVQSRVEEILEAQAGPIRCRAAHHYLRATQIAGAGSVDSEQARAARERLAAIEVPARCRR